jgi:Dna[CI] antecedent, DciA
MAQAPRFLHDLMGQVFREHRRTEHVTLVTLQEHWPSLVGPGLADRTWPSRLQHGVLWITAPDSSWAYQLQFLKHELLNGIRAGLPAFQLTDLRFKVGEIPSNEIAPAANPTLPAEPKLRPTVAPQQIAKSFARLTNEQSVMPIAEAPAPTRSDIASARSPESTPATPELARAAESIADPTLRSAFLRALSKQAQRGTDKS